MLPIHDDQPSGIFPFVTYGIIAVCTFVFAIELLTPDIGAFFAQWALVPGYIDFSQISTLYPFVTSIFLHGGLLHFLSNMWFLYIFGDNVEGNLGHLMYVLFFVAGGVVAGIAQYLFMIGQLVPLIGASGAIAAVLGYYFVKFPDHKIYTILPSFLFFFRGRLPARFVLFMWFALQLLSGVFSLTTNSTTTTIAWWAHIGGFAFGYAVAKILTPTDIVPESVSEHVEYADEVIKKIA